MVRRRAPSDEAKWSRPEFSPSPRPLKSIWPELVGKTAKEVQAELSKEVGVQVEIVSPGNLDDVTLEYRPERVQVFVDHNGRVPYAPQLG